MTVTRTSADGLLQDWRNRTRLALYAYNSAVNSLRRVERWLGGAAATLGAVAGTVVFATLSISPSFTARLIVGLVTVLAAVLVAIQTFAGFDKRIGAYEEAARQWGRVRRLIEQARLELTDDPATPSAVLTAIRVEIDAVAEQCPNAPGRIWNRTRRQVQNRYTWWERFVSKVKGLGTPGRPRRV
jgi:hypothetical protein